ncbi:MAG: LysR family transcriptional regulator [Rhizobiales bacterium]|nr:LysR family transcriptional regulator [Hyphomicrobiales bacterium]
MVKQSIVRAAFGALPLFEAAARLKSFTKASRELGLTQPAVSRRILELERILDAKLFVRRSNKLSLTPKGKVLFQAVKLGFDPIAAAISKVSTTKEQSVLTIACGFSFASMWLQPRFELLRECLSGQEIQLVAAERLDELNPDEIDIRILWRPQSWRERELIPIFPEEVSLVCSPEFAKANDIDPSHDLGFDQLQKLRLISYDHGAEEYCDWSSWFSTLGERDSTISPGYIYSNFMYAIQATLMGKGIAIGFIPLIAEYLKNGDLLCIGNVVHHRDEAIFLEYNSDALSPARASKLISWFNSQSEDVERPHIHLTTI